MLFLLGRHLRSRNFLQRFRTSSLMRMLCIFLLGIYAVQAYVTPVHQARHLAEKTLAGRTLPAVSVDDCPICHAAQITPAIKAIVTTIESAPVITGAAPLPALLTSDNAILLPPSARAPPALGA